MFFTKSIIYITHQKKRFILVSFFMKTLNLVHLRNLVHLKNLVYFYFSEFKSLIFSLKKQKRVKIFLENKYLTL
jgi:hypothetical protein